MSQPALLAYDPGAYELLLPFYFCCLLCHTSPAKMSGIKVEKDTEQLIANMKQPDRHNQDRIRLLEMNIDKTSVKVENIFRERDLEHEDVFKFVQGRMKDKVCHYYLYDCKFKTTDRGEKDELMFIMWAPDDAPVKDKMIYASSRSCLDSCLRGIKTRLQINGRDELDKLENALGDTVDAIEGHCCKGKTKHA